MYLADAIRSDGGLSWDTTYFDQNLADPVCQASILDIGKKNGKYILAFCNNADTQRRNNLTLRISYDDGLTWKKSIPVYSSDPEAEKNFDYSAYSDLVKINRKQVGVLYEKDNYAAIVFTVVKWR